MSKVFRDPFWNGVYESAWNWGKLIASLLIFYWFYKSAGFELALIGGIAMIVYYLDKIADRLSVK